MQGFSIAELQAGNNSSEEEEEEEEEEDDDDEGDGEEEEGGVDFYDPALDNQNEAWMVQRQFGSKEQTQLICPGCFSPLAFACKMGSKGWISTNTINCRLVQPATVRCSECDAEVGTKHDSEFTFDLSCIPSSPFIGDL
ncbi:hypothetical protein BASA81_000560 [Batrachochytrium salamandrivorans]|nr:hypothetical protein BASA81_000560 [Batrachochytrium salamandrivorans]